MTQILPIISNPLDLIMATSDKLLILSKVKRKEGYLFLYIDYYLSVCLSKL